MAGEVPTGKHRKHSPIGTGKRVGDRRYTDRTYDQKFFDTGFTTDENIHVGYTWANVPRHYPSKHGHLGSADEHEFVPVHLPK